MKNHHLRARLPENEYLLLKVAADKEGLTLSEYVRNVFLRDKQALTQEQLIAKIDVRLSAISHIPVSEGAVTDYEPQLAELLFLLRELVTERNPQILSRVAQRVNSIYPTRKKL
jgi:hypothetical protein